MPVRERIDELPIVEFVHDKEGSYTQYAGNRAPPIRQPHPLPDLSSDGETLFGAKLFSTNAELINLMTLFKRDLQEACREARAGGLKPNLRGIK